MLKSWAVRGVSLTYEAVRYWCRKFGQAYANQLRRRHPRPGDKWHMDEVFLTILGVCHYLWRAVDQDGIILDILVQGLRRADRSDSCRYWMKLYGCVAMVSAPWAMAISGAASAHGGVKVSRGASQQALRAASFAC
jgi:DDE domain